MALVTSVPIAGCGTSSRAADEATAPAGRGDAVPAAQALRVCADPNNLPFSNRQEAGFENRLAAMVAGDLGLSVEYTWWPQRRGFVRNTLNANDCDLIMGVPASYELAWPTQPYYRSRYVFVTRKHGPRVASLDDPALHTARIGIHVGGDDGATIPPAQALVRRGLVGNLRGYSIFGDYSQPSPPADLLEALTHGQIDVAIAWGPVAGYFAARETVALEVAAVPPDPQLAVPFEYAISMAVRRGDDRLHDRLNAFIDRRRDAIAALLREYNVPLVADGT